MSSENPGTLSDRSRVANRRVTRDLASLDEDGSMDELDLRLMALLVDHHTVLATLGRGVAQRGRRWIISFGDFCDD